MADRRSPQPDKLATTPLPPGWEAKYDYAQKRYFFIDHQTKQTTWIDPRIKQQPPPQPQQQPQHPHGGVSHVSAEHKAARHSPKPTVGWQSQVEDKYGMKVEIIKDDTNDVEPEATSRLLLRFPTVGKELVAMVSADCASEEDVCQKLRDMGYREDKQATISTSGRTTGSGTHSGPPPPPFGAKSPSHNEKLHLGSGGTNNKAPTGAFQAALSGFGVPSSDPSNASPNSRQHSKKSSPDRAPTPKNLVQSSNTSERRSASPGRPSKGKGSGHKSHTASAKASPLVEPSADKKKRLREKLEQEFKSLDKLVVESTLATCCYDEEKSRFELQLLGITKSASEMASTTSTTVAPSAGANGYEAHKMYSTGDVVAASAAPSATDDHESSSTVANGDHSNEHFGYSSSLRQETRGANASLAKGPNKQLLLSDYVVDVGSQSSHHHGPSKENYHGPCAELRQGHQPGINKGPACIYTTSSD